MLISFPLLLPLALGLLTAATLALCSPRTQSETGNVNVCGGGQPFKRKWHKLKIKSKEEQDSFGETKNRIGSDLSRYKTGKDNGAASLFKLTNSPQKTSTLPPAPVKFLISPKNSTMDLDDNLIKVLMNAQVKSISIYLQSPVSKKSK